VQAAPITWGTPFPLKTDAEINLNYTVVEAVNVGDEPAPIPVNIAGQSLSFVPNNLAAPSHIGRATLWTAADNTGNANLDAVLDSHSWGGGAWSFNLANLTPGKTYQLQLIMADSRDCCRGRSQAYGDGLGNVSGDVGRYHPLGTTPPAGGGGSVIGTFTADLDTQMIEVLPGTVNPVDPGLSAYILQETFPDTDADLMSDAWEMDHGLNVGVNDANGDPDADGSTNLQEFRRGTDPQDSDSDDDGLRDGVETKTGVYVNATDTGTDPLSDDSDNDGRLDGFETNTGTFLNATNTGTNPNNPDSDGDGLNDGVETNTGTFVSATNTGTNPNTNDKDGDRVADGFEVIAIDFGLLDGNPTDASMVPESVPRDRLQLMGVNFTDATDADDDTVTALAGAGAFRQANWNNVSDPTGDTSLLGTPLLDSVGVSAPPPVKVIWASPGTLSTPINATLSEDHKLMKGYLNDLGGLSVTFNNVPYSRFSVIVYLDTANSVAATPVLGPVWLQNLAGLDISPRVFAGRSGYFDGTYLRIDPTNPAHQMRNPVPPPGNYIVFENVRHSNFRVSGIRNADAPVTRGTVTAVQIIDTSDPNLGDSDADGMADSWETSHGLTVGVNDAALDPDTDGSTNLQEFLRDTDPQDSDTDNDGLLDGVETKTGTWVSLTNTGTDPKNPDTDGDGLRDNVETNSGTFVDANDSGTNPNKADTDSDGALDGDEVNCLGHPLLATTRPRAGRIAWSAPFAVQSDADINLGGTPAEIVRVGAAEGSGDIMVTIGSETLTFVPKALGPNNIGDANLWSGLDSTGNTALDDALDGHSWGGGAWSFALTNLTPAQRYQLQLIMADSRGCCRGRSQRYSDDVGNVSDNVGRYHPVGATPPDSGAGSVIGTFIACADGQQVINVLPGTVNGVDPGLSAYLLRRIFKITSVQYDGGAGPVTLTWESRAGATYAVDGRSDLGPLGSWDEVATDIPSGGPTTTRAVPSNGPHRFYRVREQPSP
jgi:hypothetical protein